GPQPILVQGVELYPRENAKLHNTHLYELLDGKDSSLVIRRGQTFYMAVRFKKTFNPVLDSVRLHFEFGPPPYLTQKGNLVSLPITNQSAFTREKAMWDIRTHQHEGALVTLDIQVAGTAPVGVWKMKIYSYVPGNMSMEPVVFEIPQNVYILFNPWSKGKGSLIKPLISVCPSSPRASHYVRMCTYSSIRGAKVRARLLTP
ncbi:Hemocyte protein-glutamine gamma-glutamyltransferase, partial [Araneus ventricosus]